MADCHEEARLREEPWCEPCTAFADVWGVVTSYFVVQTNGYQNVFILFLVRVLGEMACVCETELPKHACFLVKKRVLILWKDIGSGQTILL